MIAMENYMMQSMSIIKLVSVLTHIVIVFRRYPFESWGIQSLMGLTSINKGISLFLSLASQMLFRCLKMCDSMSSLVAISLRLYSSKNIDPFTDKFYPSPLPSQIHRQ